MYSIWCVCFLETRDRVPQAMLCVYTYLYDCMQRTKRTLKLYDGGVYRERPLDSSSRVCVSVCLCVGASPKSLRVAHHLAWSFFSRKMIWNQYDPIFVVSSCHTQRLRVDSNLTARIRVAKSSTVLCVCVWSDVIGMLASVLIRMT